MIDDSPLTALLIDADPADVVVLRSLATAPAGLDLRDAITSTPLSGDFLREWRLPRRHLTQESPLDRRSRTRSRRRRVLAIAAAVAAAVAVPLAELRPGRVVVPEPGEAIFAATEDAVDE